MNTFIATAELITITCPKCGGLYAINKAWREEAVRLGGFKQCWHCPYCDTVRGYGESETDKLRAELARAETAKNTAEQQRLDAELEAAHFRRSRDIVQGKLRSATKRIQHGVCPCCRRTFQNVARHMETKHPTYAKTETA